MDDLSSLLTGLFHTDRAEYTRANETLHELDGDVVPFLITALSQARCDRETWRLLLTLAEFGDMRAVPVMIDFLHCGSSAIRSIAAQFLGHAGDSRSVEPLIALIEDPDPNYSLIWVIEALQQLGDRRAVGPLVKLMQTTQSSPERYGAVEALGELGDESVVADLRMLEADTDHHVRERVAGALARICGVGPSENNASK